MRIWGPGKMHNCSRLNRVSGSEIIKFESMNVQSVLKKQKKTEATFTLTDFTTKFQPKQNQKDQSITIAGKNHIPGVLDNHDLTEGVQHALNIEQHTETIVRGRVGVGGGGQRASRFRLCVGRGSGLCRRRSGLGVRLVCFREEPRSRAAAVADRVSASACHVMCM